MRAGEVNSNIQLHKREVEPSGGRALIPLFLSCPLEGAAFREERTGQDKLHAEWRQERVTVMM